MIGLEDIRRMSLQEKLDALEILWGEIAQPEENVPVPKWHEELLDRRESLIKSGKAIFMDWDVAKQMINDAVK
jgi:hypothetical protein